MPLRTKFAVLLGLLGAAVCIALAVAWWSLDTMQRETREPVRSMASVLDRLGRTKRHFENIASALHNSPGSTRPPGVRSPTPSELTPLSHESLATIVSETDLAAAVVSDIRADDTATTRVGKSTLANLSTRLTELSAILRSPELSSPDSREAATRSLFDMHEIIERAEAKIVGDTQQALVHGVDVRDRLAVVLAIVLLLTLLSIALGLSLVRRWIVVPVQDLRSAVAQFAAGDLSYRLPGPPGSDELAQLGTEFNQMAGTIETLQKERVERERLAAVGEMVRRLAHNLRNPLGGIRGLAELTRSELTSANASPADLRENQDRIISTVDRFEHWLTDLLSATRPAQVLPIETQVLPWITSLVEAHRAAAETKGVLLQLVSSDAPTTAVFDSRHLEHAVSALISNAVEAAASTTSKIPCLVRVSLSDSGQSWMIRVQDSGQGIPVALRDQVFAPYFTTKRDGTGIGLALAAQVARAHGGQLDLVEAPGLDPALPGACFELRLPRDGHISGTTDGVDLARIGQTGAEGGQYSRHRR